MTPLAPIPEAWRRAQRILAIRLDNLGDVLVTSPAIHAIKQSLPAAEITLLASPVGAQAGRLNPDIADVVVARVPWMDPWQQLPQDSQREQELIDRLRARRFDGAIIFTSFRQSPLPAAYLCYLADIPLRLGISIGGHGSLLTTAHRPPEHMMHEVEHGLALVGAIGLSSDEHDLVLCVPEQARRDLRAAPGALHLGTLHKNGYREAAVGAAPGGTTAPAGRQPLIVLHPGCSMPARTYPWELFAEAADLLVDRLGAQIVITGMPEERPLAERICRRMRREALPLAGELPFEQFCALIEAADLTVTNNTGPMHIAAALKTPVVALFALTNPPEQWGPWRVPHRQLFHDVPCRICYSRICPYGHECLRLVTPAQVADAAEELLAGEDAPAYVAAGNGHSYAPLPEAERDWGYVQHVDGGER